MARFFTWAALALAGLAPGVPAFAASPSARGSRAIDHRQRAEAWLRAQGVDPASGIDLETFLAERCAPLRLGRFQVLVPESALADGDAFLAVGEALQALLSVQETWVSWSPDENEEPRELSDAFDELQAWLAKWRPADLQRIEQKPGTPLLSRLAPKEDVVEAAQRVALSLASVRPNEASAASRDDAVRVILFPRRSDFLSFACAAGLLDEPLRSFLWTDAIATWTEFDFDGTRAIALEYCAVSGDPDAPPISMKAKNPLGLKEHVAQLSARSLLDALYGDRLEPAVAGALANEMVIDAYGEVDTRTDGDLRSRETAARSIFVPGGNPSGGVLAKNVATSRWRAQQGKDHFIRELRAAQKQGAKLAKRADRARAFALVGDDGTDQELVLAPFLGPDASEQGPGAAFQGDFQEMLRAYGVGFLHWLRTAADGRSSSERFATLLDALRAPGPARPFQGVLAEVYGVPLSSAEPGPKDLEGRFLRWLEKQR